MGKQFKRVGTHSGKFHADEVMSTALLKELFEKAELHWRSRMNLNIPMRKVSWRL